MRTILSTAYWGNIRYYTELLAGNTVIDLNEHYVKQSYRNRCELLTANGSAQLIVPVLQPSGTKTPTGALRIDPSKHWQHQHWQTILSAYRGAAYFDHYADRIRALYEQPYECLCELNKATLHIASTMLGVALHPAYAEQYIEASLDDRDLRNALSDKPRLHRNDPHFRPEPYYQVFSDRRAFVPNLSILDLLLCEGPNAIEVLRRSHTPQ